MAIFLNIFGIAYSIPIALFAGFCGGALYEWLKKK
jgi:hypothetical protein